jgi:hypothetical protein
LNKVPVFVWHGSAVPDENWNFTGILFYGKPLIAFLALVEYRFLRESRAPRGSLSKICTLSKREALYQSDFWEKISLIGFTLYLGGNSEEQAPEHS